MTENYNQFAQNSITPNNIVGHIQKLFGTKGELIVKQWDTFPNNIDYNTNENEKKQLWVIFDSLATPIFIKKLTKQGKSKAVIIFEDFETEKLSSLLIGKKIYSNLVENTEPSLYETIINFSLYDSTSKRYFVIDGFIDNPLNPLLEVHDKHNNHLIPVSTELIKSIDTTTKSIIMSLPEGVFDL